MKTRNFFLGLFAFALLGILVFAIAELSIIKKQKPATVIQAIRHTIEKTQENQEGNPLWLIPLEEIELTCDDPWIIQTKLTSFNKSIDDLDKVGLSECYQIIGEYAIQSHLWHQGIRNDDPFQPLATNQKITKRGITLYFNYDADFNSLGTASPETVRLSGFVLHDLNGDAVFNPGEPIIPDAKICLIRDILEPICVRSDSKGKYLFKSILPGGWRFRIFNPTSDSQTEFHYINQLIEPNYVVPKTSIKGYTISERYVNLTQFNSIEDEIVLLVDQDQEHNFNLMQEWATLYTTSRDANLFTIQAYFDYDPRVGYTRIFNGETGPTYDQHDGVDISCPKGTEILSIAEGRVIAIFNESTVAIRHNNNLVSIYGHGKPIVDENQFVPRGYPVTLCDEIFSETGPHLHLATWENNPWIPVVIYGIPPFADMENSIMRWIPNNFPLQEEQIVFILQGGRGIWTEINNPHFPYVVYGDN
jgi:hypothetical protein